MRISFLIKVLAVGVLAVLLSSYFINKNKGVQSFDDTLLLTDFDVHLVNKIQIQTAANKQFINAEKVSGKWVLPNKFGYAADIKKLSKLLQNLKDTQIVELKTKQAKYYSRLGLQSLNQSSELVVGEETEQSQAKLLTLEAGDKSIQLLIGNESESSVGRYVRFAGEEQTYLVTLDINIPKDDYAWLLPNIIPISVKKISQVDITFFNEGVNEQTSSKFSIARTAHEENDTDNLAGNFELLNKTKEQVPQYDSIFTGLVRNIINITAKDIKLAESSEMKLQQSIVLTYLDNGLIDKPDNNVMLDDKAQSKTLILQLYKNDKETLSYWVRLEQSKYLINISEFDFKQISKPVNDYLE
jgi:hypothetical protein